MNFARAKIQLPRPRAAFVAREALQERLAQALATQRLVLLCAPAGYGKTTLLAQQLAQLQGRADEAITGWRTALADEEEIEVWGLAAESRVRLARALLRRDDAAGARVDSATPMRADGINAPAGAPRAAAVLSARELEVLARIAAGESNKLIAREFELSLQTAKRHVANIFGKLNVESRGQAAAWYLRKRALSEAGQRTPLRSTR